LILATRSARPILRNARSSIFRQGGEKGVDRDYAALKADPQAWSQEVQERQLFDNTLMDGLDSDERWTDDGRVKRTSNALNTNSMLAIVAGVTAPILQTAFGTENPVS
jgi:hypothetical protein